MAAVLMQFSPEGLNIEEVVKTITKYPEIDNAHHLHLWNLDDHRIHLEAHLDFVENLTLGESNAVIEKLEKELLREYHIGHTTFQCEYHRNDEKTLIVR